MPRRIARRETPSGNPAFPAFIPPQLCQLVEKVPGGDEWAHEIKYDGYRMHARLENGQVRLLTRTGLDWTDRYPETVSALRKLRCETGYLDGELCGVDPNGITSFSRIQAATDRRSAKGLIYFLFDLLHLDGTDVAKLPLIERKARLQELLANAPVTVRYSDHIIGSAEAFHALACRSGVEGVVSKQLNAPYAPDDRGLWQKTKCLNREEFIVVGWTDPEGGRPRIGALLLAYYTPDGKLTYAGRVGSGMGRETLETVWQRLQLLATEKTSLDVLPPRGSRFGTRVVLSRVHWVRPEMVVEVSYLTWTAENLLRQVTWEGIREDKPAPEVIRPVPNPIAVPPPPKKEKHEPAPGLKAASARTSVKATSSGPVPKENILQLLPEAVVPTREQLTGYWTKVADRALQHLGRRPLKLVRHVHGVTFYHKGPLPPVPDSVHQLKIEKREGGEGVRLWVDDLAGLLGLLEIGAVELHAWGATVDDIEHPDVLVFDLDPGEGIKLDFVTKTALKLRDLLKTEGLESWPKTSGGKGYHVMVPVERGQTWDEAHRSCKSIAQRIAGADPERYTLSAAPPQRKGRLFLDYLRNGRGTTAVGSYSPRARPGFPIAAPVSWEDVERGISPAAFTIEKPPRAGIRARTGWHPGEHP